MIRDNFAWHKKQNRTNGCYSCYYLNEGYKISRFYKEDGSLLYWYCDIITHEVENETNLIITDLLADVIIYPDGFVQVLDLDELCEAKEKQLISEGEFFLAIKQLGSLLDLIYQEHLSQFTNFFMNIVEKDIKEIQEQRQDTRCESCSD